MNLEILHFVFEGPSPLERSYGHEGPSTVFYLKSVRPEHEGSSSFYEGLPDLDTKRPYLRTMFFEDVQNFEADEPFENSIRFVFHSKYVAIYLEISHFCCLLILKLFPYLSTWFVDHH